MVIIFNTLLDYAKIIARQLSIKKIEFRNKLILKLNLNYYRIN
jgi:hypothetical protein